MKDLKMIYSVHHTDYFAVQITNANLYFYDLTIMLNGALDYTINGTTFRIESGDAVLVPIGCTLSRKRGEKKSDYISFNFTTSHPLGLPHMITKCVDSTVSLLVTAYDELAKQPHKNLDEKKKGILTILILHLQDLIKYNEYHALTLQIINYLHENIKSKITLHDIGQLTFFSPGYCEAIFKRDTGKSINDYLIDIRISEAKRLLAGSTRTLVNISELVGFEDYNYFSRIFKMRTGIPPRKYRKYVLGNAKA